VCSYPVAAPRDKSLSLTFRHVRRLRHVVVTWPPFGPPNANLVLTPSHFVYNFTQNSTGSIGYDDLGLVRSPVRCCGAATPFRNEFGREASAPRGDGVLVRSHLDWLGLCAHTRVQDST
jgi:hypothetical protein